MTPTNQETESIFVQDADFTVNKVDFSKENVVAEIEKIKTEQEKILDRKNVDEEKLNVVIQL